MTEYANILVEQQGRVGLVTLNRPSALNALNKATMEELVAAVQHDRAAAEPRFEDEGGFVDQGLGEPLERVVGLDGAGADGGGAGGLHWDAGR